MTHENSKRGFTLIEVLVASLLLGMLVSILTMVFNQSSIAWRTGKAGVAQLSKLRRQLSFAQQRSENVLPRIDASTPGDLGVVLSPWDEKGEVRQRSVGRYNKDGNFKHPDFQSYESSGSRMVQPWGEVTGLDSIRSGSEKTYIVGVLSYGPDGKRDTDDDITSWPENVQ